MKVLITQSNYIPWKGYFDNIAQSDVFVVYDDVQYTRRDWRNRNQVKTMNGLKWLTIPVEVKGKYHQKINETVVSGKDWAAHHWNLLSQHYSRAPFFRELGSWVAELYDNCSFSHLTEINTWFLKAICDFLGIKTVFRDSREFELVAGKTEKLVSICKDLGATAYLSGPSAKDYLDENLFRKENIRVDYADYSGYKEYPQQFPPFEHSVCIWDLLFNTGSNARFFLKHAVEGEIG